MRTVDGVAQATFSIPALHCASCVWLPEQLRRVAPEYQRLFDALNLALSMPVLLFSAADWFRGAIAALRAGAITLDVP